MAPSNWQPGGPAPLRAAPPEPGGRGGRRWSNTSPRLRPHPAIAQLLDLIGPAPDVEAAAAAGARRTTAEIGDDEWLRLPGLFRRWELEQIVDAEHDFHVEAAGHCEDGTQLFAVYARAHQRRNDR